MRRSTIFGFSLILLTATALSGLNAKGLQEFLQPETAVTNDAENTVGSSTESASAPATQVLTPSLILEKYAPGQLNQTSEPVSATEDTAVKKENTSELTHIIEMVVAGVVGSALILSLLVLFLGRWVARKDKLALKSIRLEAEHDRENITAAATTIREQEKETTQILRNLRSQSSEVADTRDRIASREREIGFSLENAHLHQHELEQVAKNVSKRMTEIQSYWDDQLRDTVSAIHKVQSSLDENLNKVDDGLEKMHRQKAMSEELMQDFLKRHNEQNSILENNSKISDQVSQSLEETLRESTHLLKLLKKQQSEAEHALKNFNNELSGYEEQAYEQFDSSFQVADIARQELSANIEESRNHLERMRRYEEQSHGINVQTQKHLELLDYTKIVKLSHTLNSTQDMFNNLRDSVEKAQHMMTDLKNIETDVKQTADSVKKEAEKIDDTSPNEQFEGYDEVDAAAGQETDAEFEKLANDLQSVNNTAHVDLDYKIASGDNAPLSFFKHLQPKKKS